MKTTKQTRKFVVIVLILFGCAQKEEQEIERKVAEEAQINSITEFNEESDRMINEAKDISDAQRAKLIVLRRETIGQIDEKDKEELRLRLVLFKEVLNTDYNKKEINIVKQKIKNLNGQKYSLLMEAVKESNHILGKPYAEDKNVLDFDHTVRDYEFK